MEESNFYTISDNPIYNSEIRKLKNSDPANARTVFNPLFERIINNIEAVRLNEKKLIDEHNKSETAHKGMSFPANGGNADTVGGKQASDFALKNHSHTDFSAWDSDSDSDTSWGVSISASGINFQWNDDINDSELHISENGLMGGGSFLPAISNFGNISAQSFLGNGSNLTNVNADTVDGKHASDFQLIK